MISFKEILSIEEKEGSLKGARRESWQLLLVQSGLLQVFCNGKFYLLGKSDCMLISPYSFLSGDPKSESPSYLVVSFKSGEEPSSCAYSLPEALGESLFTYRKEPEFAPLLALAILQRERAHAIDPLLPRANAALFSKAAALLEERYLNAPSVDALAEELSLSLSKLKRLFARYAGIGTHEYLMELRIALGKQALNSGRSVTETAELCGFANQAYFSAAFKKATGLSPMEYLSKSAPSKPATRKPRKETPPKPSAKRDMPNYLL